MRAMRARIFTISATAILLFSAGSRAQIVINEMVDDERTSGSGQVRPDTREFVELYNSGASAVDISGWTMNVIQIGLVPQAPATTSYTIPPNTPAVAPGGYFVISTTGSTVSNVNLYVNPLIPNGAGNELFPEDAAGGGNNTPTGNFVLEIRNGSTLVDALATETFRDPERAPLTAEQVAKVGGGYWAQTISMNPGSSNPIPQSFARYRDGVTTNNNGRDFGFLPLTPGTTNNLPQHAVHAIPDVDSYGLEQNVDSNYYASFVLPRAIDPTNADGNAINPTQISASPQGGKAIIVYDETGGGNVAYSKEYVHKFDLYAYIETGSLSPSLVNATTPTANEASIYGIGTSDPFFGTPDSAGLVGLASSANGSTGFGWVIQRVISFNGGSPISNTVLQLVDFGASGDSVPAKKEWSVIKSYDLSSASSGWHRLSVDYNSITGSITAKNDADTTVFSVAGDFNSDGKVDAADYVAWRINAGTTNVLPNDGIGGTIGQAQYDLWRQNFGKTAVTNFVGNFYVGYREALGGNFSTARPPTFDMIGGGGGASLVPEPASALLALVGILLVPAGRRRK